MAPKKKKAATKRVALRKLDESNARATDREFAYRAEYSGWTPDKVMAARAAADGGSMRLLADFCETLFTDDRISGILSTRTHGLLGLPIDFHGGSAEAIAALEGTEEEPGEWWTMHEESELVKLEQWGIGMGVGLAQRIPLPRLAGEQQKYRMETWSPRWLTYYHHPVDGVHWKLQTQNGIIPIFGGDGQWILYTPYGARRPWAEGRWQALALPWLLKHYALEDRANYSESLGNPVGVGSTGEGSTEKQRDRFLSQLRELGKNGKLVLPKGWTYNLVEATGKSTDLYKDAIADSNEAFAVILAGQVVTTEGTTGFSDGNVHEAITQNLLRFDDKTLSSCLRRQSLAPWASVNYGNKEAAPWPKIQTQKPADANEEAQSLGAIGDAIAKLDAALAPHGLKSDAQKIIAKFDVPVLNITK